MPGNFLTYAEGALNHGDERYGTSVDQQHLCRGSAADVLLTSREQTQIVKKVMRVVPTYFDGKAVPSEQNIIEDLRTRFSETFGSWHLFEHDRIVKLFFVDTKALTLYEEYCVNGDLRRYYGRIKSDIECTKIFKDIVEGLAYLQSQTPPIIHGCINPGSIYITGDCRAKLGEPCFSQLITEISHLTPSISVDWLIRWMSPEFFQEEYQPPLTPQSDMWSLGCTFLEVITGCLPYHGHKSNTEVLELILAEALPDLDVTDIMATSSTSRNFTCTEIEIFCGKGTALKKVPKDRRGGSSRLEEPPHRLKERPSWLSLSRRSSSSLISSTTWKPATCNLLEERGQATLRVYTEDQHINYSIHVNTLFAPHIRIVDPSLHSRRHVLVIYESPPVNAAPSSGTMSSTIAHGPVYLAFRRQNILNSWLVLLRSFARPDIRPYPHPVTYTSPQNISYRIWRQLQVTIFAGRKFGDRHIFGRGCSDESNSKDSKEEPADSDRWEGEFEIVLNGIVVGRTCFKTLPGLPWSTERVTISDPHLGDGTWAGADGAEGTDFSGFNSDMNWGGSSRGVASAFLEIRGIEVKSGFFTSGPTMSHSGTLPIDLGPFRRGEAVKAWWPGYIPPANTEQNGELLMEVKFDEEIVLPLEMYTAMKDILIQRNYFELWRDLTTRIPIPMPVSAHLVSLALYHGNLISQLASLAHAEIHEENPSPSTLFRGNSTLTRLTESTMAILGAQGFLESSIGHVVRRIYQDKVVFETYATGPNTAAVMVEGADPMAYWLQQLWDAIWKARDGCPNELRHLFFHIRTQVEARWGSSALYADLKYQSISAFLFLRLFIPALLQPSQYGLVVGPPPDGVERTLKYLAKALQSLANLNAGIQREEFGSAKAFNEDNVDAMIDYLTFVSTPSDRRPVIHSVPPTLPSSHLRVPQTHIGMSRDLSPELQISAALQARLPSMPALHRESLPILPYMTDEARDFAAIASAVVRYAYTPSRRVMPLHRDIGPKGEGFEESSHANLGDEQHSKAEETRGGIEPEVPPDVIRFIKACFDVQAEAMRRVSPAPALNKRGRRRQQQATQDDNSSLYPPEQPNLAARVPSTERSFEWELGSGLPVSLALSTGPESSPADTEESFTRDSRAGPETTGQAPQSTDIKKRRKGIFESLGLSSRKRK